MVAASVTRVMNAGRPPSCKMTGRIVRVREEVPTHVFLHFGLGQLGPIFDQLLLEITPRKVRVALRKPCLCQRLHHLRPRKGFRKKDDVRMIVPDFCDQPLPEGGRLRVRIIDPKTFHPLIDPEQDNAPDFFPQRAFQSELLKLIG